MTWWNSSWTKKKAITLTGGASGAQSAYQVKLTVTYDSDMKSDFSDLRFTNAAENALLDSWMESHTASTSAVIWVETNTPANNVDADIYMYYGNSGAASDWDGAATFNDFIDNEGSLSEWDVNSGGVSATTDHPFKGSYGIKFPTTGSSPSPKVQKNCIGKNKIYETWIYDDMITTANFQNMARLYDISGADPTVGIWTGTSTTHYVYRPEGGSWTASSVARSSGWHKLQFDAASSDTKVYIDGTLIFTESALDEDNLDYFYISGYTGGTGYTDTFIVRQYAANPPTYAFGSEESPFIPTIIIM
jgi:hypothetical protein